MAANKARFCDNDPILLNAQRQRVKRLLGGGG